MVTRPRAMEGKPPAFLTAAFFFFFFTQYKGSGKRKEPALVAFGLAKVLAAASDGDGSAVGETGRQARGGESSAVPGSF